MTGQSLDFAKTRSVRSKILQPFRNLVVQDLDVHRQWTFATCRQLTEVVYVSLCPRLCMPNHMVTIVSTKAWLMQEAA